MRRKKVVAQPSEPTFRVISIGLLQKERTRAARDAIHSTNRELIDRSVNNHLANIVSELQEAGLERMVDAGPVRLPFTDETLSLLKVASEETGVAAVQLLRIALSREAESILAAAPRRRGRKPASKRGGKR